ncbi:MAG: hypothetical protein GY866_42120 [Proteobacteria bacterium]|nr:hypothetical protein [Pseudomonadota bacterium]
MSAKNHKISDTRDRILEAALHLFSENGYKLMDAFVSGVANSRIPMKNSQLADMDRETLCDSIIRLFLTE